MNAVGQKEIRTQERLLELMSARLGYRYLGNWETRAENSNIELALLEANLLARGYSEELISRAVHQFTRTAGDASKSLYNRNRETYELLRYGVKVKTGVGEHYETVWLIDWDDCCANDFAVAEEVTVPAADARAHGKRPDIVIYVNGIAVGVVELKRSTVSVANGIRQNLDNQKKEFIEHFFSTVQVLMAGNDTEGLRYAPIATPEKYWLEWKESGDDAVGEPLDRAVVHLLEPERLLEVIHDFVVFDAGVKKLCRHNQYFGVKAAQARALEHDGGILWHTQGSGKSLTMVWLAKWIKENIPGSRVLIVTDRDELDKQIKAVFDGVSEPCERASSGKDLIELLNRNQHSIMCSLVQKFGASAGEASSADIDRYADELLAALPAGFSAKGDIFVFVDEAHRSHSGKLHQAMRTIIPGATLIGFTGTPLLSEDKQRTIEVFGTYIHTYKYDEAVRDGVVLDLRYEARDIDQRITSQTKIDAWFDAATKGLNDNAKQQLKAKWATMRAVMSSKTRLAAIVSDIVMDMSSRPRLADGHGNAILVASSVYEACKYFELFQDTPLKGKVAIVSSYEPTVNAIKGEEVGEGDTEALEKYQTYRVMLAEWFDQPADAAVKRIDEFEEQAKQRFIDEPGRLKLLIVVDKLLTGFDAPPATYLYIDKQMRDHGLFQAICRVNRLDGDSKEYGYVVDYKDLFNSLRQAVTDYTNDAFDAFDAEDVRGLLADRLTKAKERLDETREQVKALCELVVPPQGTDEFIAYFTTASSDVDEIANAERLRLALYRAVGAFVRAYADLANEMTEAGYTAEEADAIKRDAVFYEAVRQEVRLASGDAIDLKAYEPGMRYLIDTYIRSDESEVVSDFDDLGFLDLFVTDPAAAVGRLPEALRPEGAAAAVIENNIRRVIVDENPVNPKYFDKMSELLAQLVEKRRQDAISYRDYLAEMRELALRVKDPGYGMDYPAGIDSAGKRALFDQLGNVEAALAVDAAVLESRQDRWREHPIKRRRIEMAIEAALVSHPPAGDFSAASALELVEQQAEY